MAALPGWLRYGCGMVNLIDLPREEVVDGVLSRDDASAVSRLLLLRLRSSPLVALMTTWDLSATQAGALFGVSRQAITKWINSAPPPDRADDVAGMAVAISELERNLKPDRISAVVRRPQEALGGSSLLEFAQSHSGRQTAGAARAMFDIRQIQP